MVGTTSKLIHKRVMRERDGERQTDRHTEAEIEGEELSGRGGEGISARWRVSVAEGEWERRELARGTFLAAK